MKKFMKKYGFITLMLLGIVAGCIVGAAWPGAYGSRTVRDAVY